MDRKDVLDLILAKVDAETGEKLVKRLRKAAAKEERSQILAEFGITLTDEEREALQKKADNELSDEELDRAAGGCGTCSCECACS